MAKFQCNVISYTLKRTVDLVVVVPTTTIPESLGMGLAEGEKPTHQPKAKYPVLYLLHGGGNNQAQWTGYTKAELFAEEHQIIVVNIAGENKFFDNVRGDDFYTFIQKELPDFVTGLFPASDRPEDTYIAGLSMGGYGTMIHALTTPERFAAMGIFSCGGAALKPNGSLDLPAVPAEHVPNDRLDAMVGKNVKLPKVYYACGKNDFGYQGCLTTRDKFLAAGADVTWDELEGYGHEWRFWDIELEKFLKWLPRTDAYAGSKRKV